MNIWHDISARRISVNQFEALVEIPKGCKVKYELDKETGLLRMDRVLYTSTVYPANYGFIPHTLAADHDPLDVLILCSESLIPMSLVQCYPIGVIVMNDGGDVDEKIIVQDYVASHRFQRFKFFWNRMGLFIAPIVPRLKKILYGMMAAKPRYLTETMNEIKAEYGSIINYCKERLEITDGDIKKMREKYLEPAKKNMIFIG